MDSFEVTGDASQSPHPEMKTHYYSEVQNIGSTSRASLNLKESLTENQLPYAKIKSLFSVCIKRKLI